MQVNKHLIELVVTSDELHKSDEITQERNGCYNGYRLVKLLFLKRYIESLNVRSESFLFNDFLRVLTEQGTGISKADIAAYLQVSRSTVNNWAAEGINIPGPHYAIKEEIQCWAIKTLKDQLNTLLSENEIKEECIAGYDKLFMTIGTDMSSVAHATHH